jgi:hypothetical protein
VSPEELAAAKTGPVPASPPDCRAEDTAYEHWRDESNRAEREFRAATRKPRADLEMALEEADRSHKERIAVARRSVVVASHAHRRALELAHIDHRKAIDLAEANLKEAMAKARTPVREAEAAFKSTSEQSRRTLETELAKAREAFERVTATAYAERRKIKTEAWGAYLKAHEAAATGSM